MHQYRNKNFLKQKYIKDRLSCQQIADISGTSKETIRYWLRKYKIHRKRVTQSSQRKVNKRAALDYLGCKCCYCGYNKPEEVLQFHHVYPEHKKYTISSGLGRQWTSLRKELDKCALLCANCHISLHHGCINNKIVEKHLLNRLNKQK